MSKQPFGCGIAFAQFAIWPRPKAAKSEGVGVNLCSRSRIVITQSGKVRSVYRGGFVISLRQAPKSQGVAIDTSDESMCRCIIEVRRSARCKRAPLKREIRRCNRTIPSEERNFLPRSISKMREILDRPKLKKASIGARSALYSRAIIRQIDGGGLHR